jgi:mannitol/fructose-specific phosphotransferase system IIA component (Ntr-type)
MGFKQKKGDTKRLKFLLAVYPNRKQDELEMLSQLMTLKDLKYLAEQHGYSDKEIDKLF